MKWFNLHFLNGFGAAALLSILWLQVQESRHDRAQSEAVQRAGDTAYWKGFTNGMRYTQWCATNRIVYWKTNSINLHFIDCIIETNPAPRLTP